MEDFRYSCKMMMTIIVLMTILVMIMILQRRESANEFSDLVHNWLQITTKSADFYNFFLKFSFYLKRQSCLQNKKTSVLKLKENQN
jgi:hypothetical protein